MEDISDFLVIVAAAVLFCIAVTLLLILAGGLNKMCNEGPACLFLLY